MTLHDIIHILLINWKVILKYTVGSAIIIFMYLLLISPVTYKAPVTILPPTETDQISGLGSLISGGGVGDFLTGKLAPGNSQLFIQILKSRTAAEYVIRKNNLLEFYDEEKEYAASKTTSTKFRTGFIQRGNNYAFRKCIVRIFTTNIF